MASQPGAPGPEDWGRIFADLPRAEPPEIELDALLARWAARRRRTYALGGALAAAVLVATVALTWGSEEPAPPAHLELQVVETAPGTVVDQPDEAELPNEVGP